ncbi:MAG: enoyl-CoA hydratase/isomerase family protein [Elusimicrobia bacterium]|nr:enoyl-CoA hydratase/isomerase family protein [Elusimicrobiota bacterium]
MTTATAPELLSETKDGILTLTLNRPEVLNSLTMGMMKGLTDALKKAERDKAVRVVVMTAAGRAFCAGADLGDLQRRQAAKAFSLGDELRNHFNPLILQIRKMEKPVVGAINGLAAGAGASLVLSCDVKVCSESAKFINAFTKVGLVPDSGMTYFMPRYLGLSLALEHAWTAKPITPAQALQFGWVNYVVAPDQVAAKTAEVAGEIAKAPPLSVALTKRAINRAFENSFEAQMEYEAQLQEILGKTKDHAEGVKAFLEKRPPQFKGE